MHSVIIEFPGSNCVAETQRFLDNPTMVWHTETELPDADLYVLPGGFSYGDYMRGGALAGLSPIIKSLKQKKKTIACIEWIDPLMAAGNWIPEMVKISGGEDIFGKSGKDSHWVKFDEIQKHNPEIIIFLPCGYNIEKTKQEVKNLFSQQSKWNGLNAFLKKEIYIVDGNQFFNRPGPRLVESLEIFAEIIHPELFNFNHNQSGWINFFK